MRAIRIICLSIPSVHQRLSIYLLRPPPSAGCPVSSVCQTVVSLLLSTYLVYTSDGTRGINGEWTYILRVWSCQLANKMYTWCSSILVWWVHACVHADWVRITEVTQHFGYFRAIRMLSLIFLSRKEAYSQQRAASKKKQKNWHPTAGFIHCWIIALVFS